MRIFLATLFLMNLFSISYAENQTITLPDGTTRIIEVRKIYSSPNKADDLTDAIAANDLEMIKKIVNEGANINEADSSGNLPLFEALNEQKSEMLDFLLSHGADVNLTAKMPGIETSPIQIAVNSGYKTSLKKLLEHGAKIDVQDGLSQETVLFLAVRKGDPEVVKILIDHGADVQHKNMLGETPISLAEKVGNDELLKILKKE